jgi:hypothetical protein
LPSAFRYYIPWVPPQNLNTGRLQNQRGKNVRQFAEETEGKEFIGAVDDVNLLHKPHLEKPRGERSCSTSIHEKPGCLPVVDNAHRVLEMTVRIEQKGFRGLTSGELVQSLTQQ